MPHPGRLNCRELVELVTDYLDGELTLQARRNVAAHLSECESCATYVEQIRWAVTLVGRLGDHPGDPR